MRSILLLSLLCFVSLFPHFVNLNWGAPYYFHPDERNIASSITQLNFPNQMNPHFFAYGSLPLYAIYFLGILVNFFSVFTNHTQDIFSVSFSQAIIIGRFFSAFFSILLIPLIYLLGKKMHSEKTGLFAAVLTATSIGFIQFAHFATFEMWLTIFSILLTYFSISFLHASNRKNLFFLSILLGILISIKISSFVLFLPVFFTVFITYISNNRSLPQKILKICLSLLSVTSLAFFLFFLSNPYIFIANEEFLNSIHYETAVALGKLPVFYTQAFINNIPVFYQFFHVFPFLLNPFVFPFVFPSLLYFIWDTYKKRSIDQVVFFLFFLTIFLSQSLIFVKWTRYMVPVLAYLYVIIAFLFSVLSVKREKRYWTDYYARFFIYVILGLSIICAFLFISLTYLQTDSRIQAYVWARKNIPKESSILSEVYDLGITPFNNSFPHITLFNFYDMENKSQLSTELEEKLSTTDYIILPSQKILKNRIVSPSFFPKSSMFYKNLLREKGYKKIYQTSCDIWCRIIYNNDPVFHLEETTTVFDKPTIYIFKKL